MKQATSKSKSSEQETAEGEESSSKASQKQNGKQNGRRGRGGRASQKGGEENGQKSGSSSSGQRSARKSSGNTIKKMFEDLLKDTYGAEKQLMKALPKVASAVSDEDLRFAIEDHIEKTERHIKRAEKVFRVLRLNTESEKCEAMEGLIEEAEQIIQENEEGPIRDSALIIGCQKIEHYEIAAYGSLRTLADVMGYHQASDILDRTLGEEEEADQILNEIAEYVNLQALEESLAEEEEDV
jgi:ferritin-like metal-binding protein YciE